MHHEALITLYTFSNYSFKNHTFATTISLKLGSWWFIFRIYLTNIALFGDLKLLYVYTVTVTLLGLVTTVACVCSFSSFFQSICVLGYCVLPLALALIVCRLILLVQDQTVALFSIRFVIVLVAFAWSTFGEYLYRFVLISLLISHSILYGKLTH